MRPPEPQMPGRREDVVAALQWCLDLAQAEPDCRPILRVTAQALVRAVYGWLVIYGKGRGVVVLSPAPEPTRNLLADLLRLPVSRQQQRSHKGTAVEDAAIEAIARDLPHAIWLEGEWDPADLLLMWSEALQASQQLREIIDGAGVTDDEALAMYLVRGAGMTERDAAEVLGVTRLTLYKRIRRANTKIEDYLAYVAWAG